MNIWQRLATRIKARFTRDTQPWMQVVFGRGKTTAGEYVDANTALRVSVVWACLSYLSRTVAQLPWRVMMETERGAEEMRGHPVSRILRLRPNPEIGPFTFKEQMVWWAASWGNAVAEIVRDNRGAVIGLYPIHPSRVTFERVVETGELVYRIWNDNSLRAELSPDQVFHLRGFGDGPVGLDVISYAAESIGWSRATEVFGAAFFGQGMAPSGIIKSAAGMKPDGFQKLKEELASVMSGAKNSHRTLILDADMDYKTLAVNPQAAQLLEIRQHQVEEICRWFGVPPHKIMHLLRATFSNIEHQSIEVVVDSITPWAKRLEEEADYKLFGLNRGGFYTKLDLKGLLRGDFKTRAEGYKLLREMGVLSVNEIRVLEDMNPIGDEGDKRIVPLNMTTLERLGEEPPDPAPAPVVEEDPAVDRARRIRQTAAAPHWLH